MIGQVDIFKYSWIYDAVLLMMFIVFVTDAIGIIKSISDGKQQIREYCDQGIRYLRIFMQLFAAVFFFGVAFSGKYDLATNAINIFVAAGTLLDAGVSLFLKIKYR